MTETQVKVIAGLDSIGGNIVVLEKDNYQIVTDFGIIRGTTDSEALDLAMTSDLVDRKGLPQLDGLYPQKQLKAKTVEAYETSQKQTIICISHLHLDHIGALLHLAPQIPVYTSQESYDFYQALAQTGFLPDYQVNWQGVAYDEVLEHGPFKIQFKASDHDTKGIAAIFIESPDLKVIHSGDFRYSGFHPEKVFAWGQAARQFEADLALLEGTTFSFLPDPNQAPVPLEPWQEKIKVIESKTELSLLKNISQLLEANSQASVVFNGYEQNLERLLYLSQVLSQLGRQLALDEKYYQLALSFAKIYGLKYDNICLADLPLIKKNPQNYVLNLTYDHYQDMFELPAGLYLHSNGYPLGPYMPAYQPFVLDLQAHNWQMYQMGSSGHAYPQDLLNQAYLVNAKVTVPWHSSQPDLYAQGLSSQGLKVWRPIPYQTYSASQIKALKEDA